MAQTLTLTRGFSHGGQQYVFSEDLSSGLVPLLDEDIAANQTNKAVAFALDISQCSALAILATQDCTLETNSGSAPDDTFTLKANKPVIWSANHGFAIPLSADITGLFVTNIAALNLKFFAVVDPTT